MTTFHKKKISNFSSQAREEQSIPIYSYLPW